MNKKSLLLTALFTCYSISLFAHGLWIQTAGTAVKGEKHPVEILWAEDGKNELMPISKWFSDMKDFTLFVTSPDGTKRQMPVTAAEDRYTADFTPDHDGIYILSIVHTAKDFGDARLEYNAEAMVTVGKVAASSAIPAIDNELRLTGDFKNTYRQGKTVSLSYLFKNAPKEKIEVAVFAPNGWNKTFETDAKGSIQLPLLWSGHYAVEARYYAEDEGGDLNGKSYKATWRCITYTFDSKQ